MVNLLSNDVSRFDFIFSYMHALWVSPLMTIIAIYILWIEVRWAGIIGTAVIFIIVPIQSNFSYNSKHIFTLRPYLLGNDCNRV